MRCAKAVLPRKAALERRCSRPTFGRGWRDWLHAAAPYAGHNHASPNETPGYSYGQGPKKSRHPKVVARPHTYRSGGAVLDPRPALLAPGLVHARLAWLPLPFREISSGIWRRNRVTLSSREGGGLAQPVVGRPREQSLDRVSDGRIASHGREAYDLRGGGRQCIFLGRG